MNRREWTTNELNAAIETAMEVGMAEAARRHGICRTVIRYHVRKRGLKPPYFRSGNRRKKDCEVELAVLSVLFAGVPLSQREIAEVCGLSKQRVEQIEKKALRKVRWRLLELGFELQGVEREAS